MRLFNFVGLLIIIEIQKSYQQSPSCSLNTLYCCDNSCSSCTQDKISECTKCSSQYFYINEQYKCLQKCPQGTYVLNEIKRCQSCSSQYCEQCTENSCLKCQEGFILDHNDSNNCISYCDQQNKVRDESGQCNYRCLDDIKYDVDNKSKSCVTKISCPTLKKIPEVQNKANIVSTLLDKNKQLMTSIDKAGNAVLFSYPDLVEQLGYSLPVNSSSVVECVYIDDNYLKNDTISCLLSPMYLLQFYSSNGTVTYQQTISDRTFIKGFESNRNWSLIQSQKDSYELQLIDYSQMKYITIDTFSSPNFMATVIKTISLTPVKNAIEIINLNFNDSSLTYYNIITSNKIIIFTSTIVDLTSKLIQMNSIKYWILYTNKNFQLLKFDSINHSMSLVQTYSLDDQINSIFMPNIYKINQFIFVAQILIQKLINKKDIIFIVGTSFQQLRPMYLDQTQDTLFVSQSNINEQLNSPIQIYVSSQDTIIACLSKSINAYIFLSNGIRLQYLGDLREKNSNLCSLSSFQSIKINKEIHILQIIQMNINLNIINLETQQNYSRFVVQFADTSQLRAKLTEKISQTSIVYTNLIYDNPETQQLLEIKSFGLIYTYDLIKKNLINQVRIWYPYNEQTVIYFNCGLIANTTYLFQGFEGSTFKIKIINIKTLEITYVQEFPDITIPINDLNIVNPPIYFPQSDSIVVHLQRKKLLTDTQKRYDLFFIQKNQDQNSSIRYKLVNSISISAYSFLYSIQSEMTILFDLVSTQTYKTYIYNKSGQKVYTQNSYNFRDTNRFGQVNESAKQLHIYTYTQGIFIVDLTTLQLITSVFSSSQGRCIQNCVFNDNFTYIYLFDTCKTEGVYAYPPSGQTPIKTNSPVNSILYSYAWYGNYLSFRSYTTNLILYDSSINYLFRVTSIHGTNIGSLVQDNTVTFFNNFAISHYNIATQKLLLAEVYKYQYSTNIEAFKSIAIDMDLGYLVSTNLDKDCVFNMNTLQRNCYKEVENYQGQINAAIQDYNQELFINQKTKTVIICQMMSIRLFSLIDFKYINSIYDSYLDGGLFFYNPYYNYIIYSQKTELIFTSLNLNNMSKKKLSLPQPSKDWSSTHYRFHFFSDKKNYLFLNSNFLYIQTNDQQTHALQSTLFLDQAFYPSSTWIVDVNRKYIFLIDYTNSVAHYSFDTNKLIFKYQLNTTDVNDVQKDMIWDTYKQKLIVNSYNTLYVIGISKNIIEFYYSIDNDKILQIQLIPNKNQFSVSSFSTCTTLDYDYLISDNKDIFPNQLNPRYYKINDEIVFHLNDKNSIATLFINKKIKGTWVRNNLKFGNIRIIDNDVQNLLVYAIFDNEISILDVSKMDVQQIDQVFLSQNIIGILFEDSNNIYLRSQSQQILTLEKQKKNIQINEAIILTQGVSKYIFIQSSMRFLFTDFSLNQNINIVSFNKVQNTLKGNLQTPIQMASRIVSFALVTDTLIVILLENNVIIYDLNLQQISKSGSLPISHIYSNVKVDSMNQRIFVQNQNTGSLIFDYSLIQSQSAKYINSFSTDLSFDEHFIYSINGHSANIYFRKDLKFLVNFRSFDMNFWLKKVTYLGVGYIFIVQFLTKLSIYELSPFSSQPVEKDFVSINQFTIIDFKLSKLYDDKNDNGYKVDVTGFTQEGMFTYTFKFDLYNQGLSQSCSWQFLFQEEVYQETNILNQMTQQLTGQNKTLDSLVITIITGQIMRLPQIINQIASSNFGIQLSGTNGDEKLFIKNPLSINKNISFLKLKKLNIDIHPTLYEAYTSQKIIPIAIEINLINFPILKQFILEDIILYDTQINVVDINQVVIKNLIFRVKNQLNIQSLAKIQIVNTENVLISSLIIDQSEFYLLNPIMSFRNIRQLTISKLSISKSSFHSIQAIFQFESINTIQIEELIINENIINESPILFFTIVNTLKIETLTLVNTKFYSKNYRILNEISDTQKIIKQLFQFINMDNIIINKLRVDQFQSDSNYKFLLFSIKYIKTLLSIKESSLNNILINQQQDGVLFALEGIQDVQLNVFNVQQIKFIQLLLLQAHQISEVTIQTSYSIQIQDVSILNYQTSSKNAIEILSLYTKIDNLTFKNIKFISQEQQQKQQQTISVIKIKSSKQLTISNSNFLQIIQFNDALLQIYESSNVLIEKNVFQNIYSLGSGAVTSISQSSDVKLNSNSFSYNTANQDAGVIFFKNTQGISVSQNRFDNNQSLKGQGGCIYSTESQFNVIQSNSFDLNSSLKGSGGAFYCSTGSILLFENNQFNQNSAINGSGGAILLNNCDILQLKSNIFHENSAFIGGAIRYKILKPIILINQNLRKLKIINQFIKNKCISYGKDFGSYATILDVKNSYEDDKRQRNAIIDNVQSGYQAQNPIFLRFIDEEMSEINFIEFKQNPDIMNEIKEEFSLYILQTYSDEIGLLGDLKQGYSKENYAFVFDLSYSYHPNNSSSIQIKSTQSLPQFLPDTQLMVQQQFDIQITIKFRECQVGEVKQNSGLYILCFTCEEGFYSLVIPNSAQDISCKRCPLGSTNCQGNQITLEKGYWRSGGDSDIIIYCTNNPENCQPQNEIAKQGCIEGYKGPLCEECDTNGEVWRKQFSKVGSYSCMDCESFSSATNVITFIVIFVFILSQIYLKAYKQVIVTKKYILAVYLAKLGLISPNIEKIQTQQASLMKILLNYFQFMMIVNSLGITLPIYFTAFNVSGGDASQQTINRIDCFLFYYKSDLPNYIIRVLWVNSQPLFLFIFLEIISQFTIQITQISAQKQTIYTNLIIVFSFYQPSITKVLSQSFSCRTIGDKEYILSDLTQRCLTEEHLKYFYKILLPLGIFWIFFCPLFLFYRMNHYKNRLDKIKIIYRYGYLYQNYELKHYYWDILRMFIRSLAIISINVLNFRVLFKGLIILGLIYYYMMLSKKMKPYRLQKFNYLDKESCFLVIQTLYLIYIGYLSENIIISYLVAIFVAILNGRFLIKMIGFILIKPISPNKAERNRFQQILFTLKQTFPFLFFWVIIANNNRAQAFKNWKKVQQQFIRIKQLSKTDSESSRFNQLLSSGSYRYQKLIQYSQRSTKQLTTSE